MNSKATVTVEELITLNVEGFEPMKDLRKKSSWNGLWELRDAKGALAIVLAETGTFDGFFSNLPEVFGDAEASHRQVSLVAVSTSLLIPSSKVKEA